MGRYTTIIIIIIRDENRTENAQNHDQHEKQCNTQTKKKKMTMLLPLTEELVLHVVHERVQLVLIPLESVHFPRVVRVVVHPQAQEVVVVGFLDRSANRSSATNKKKKKECPKEAR